MVATKKNTTKVRIIEKSIRDDRDGDDPFADLTAERFATFAGIKDSRPLLGVAHDLYVRQLLHAGRIEGVKVQLKGYTKWFIDPVSIEYYTANKARRSGLRRYLLRANSTDEETIRHALNMLGIEYTLEISYKKKK